MNLFDVFLLFVLLLSLWFGWQKGFIWGMSDLLAWCGSIATGYFLYPPLARLLNGTFSLDAAWAKPVAFITLVLASRFFFSYLFRTVLGPIGAAHHSSIGNRVLGMFPGFIHGLLTAAVLAGLMLTVPFSNSITQVAHESRAADELAAPMGWFGEKVAPIFADAISAPNRLRTIYPRPDETVKLPFTVAESTPRSELEQRMIGLVNSERVKRGLPALRFDPELTPVARKHSMDMLRRGYFSHYSPEGYSVSDRLKEGGVTYLYAGENLALAPGLATAHSGLMKSPGHRANILHKAYRQIGIGIMDGGIRGIMVTQVFKK